MADITMCSDAECARNIHCYRFRARMNEHRQSYFKDSPREGEGCDQYWSTSGWDDRSLTPMKDLVETMEVRE